MTAAKRNEFDDLGTDDKEEFKIVELDQEQDVEKMPEGFELVPITRPSPHEGKPPILSGYALKRVVPLSPDFSGSDRDVETFCGR